MMTLDQPAQQLLCSGRLSSCDDPFQDQWFIIAGSWCLTRQAKFGVVCWVCGCRVTRHSLIIARGGLAGSFSRNSLSCYFLRIKIKEIRAQQLRAGFACNSGVGSARLPQRAEPHFSPICHYNSLPCINVDQKIIQKIITVLSFTKTWSGKGRSNEESMLTGCPPLS